MSLDGSTCSESLPEGTCHFEPPEHVPRTSARAQTCSRGPGGFPACHGAESTTTDPRPEEKKIPMGQKKSFVHSTIIRSTYEERVSPLSFYSRARGARGFGSHTPNYPPGRPCIKQGGETAPYRPLCSVLYSRGDGSVPSPVFGFV